MSLLIRHLARVASDLVRHSVSTRNVSVLLLVLLGAVIVVGTLLAQAIGPVVVYPFL